MLYRFPWLGWMAFIAVALGEALLSRNGDQQTAPPTRRGSRALVAVGIAAVLVFAVRAVAAFVGAERDSSEGQVAPAGVGRVDGQVHPVRARAHM